jgi:hypothetical protein
MLLGKFIVLFPQILTFPFILINFVDKSRFGFLAQNAYEIYLLQCNNFEYLQANSTMIKLSMVILSLGKMIISKSF